MSQLINYSIYIPFEQNFDRQSAELEYTDKEKIIEHLERYKTTKEFQFFDLIGLDCVEDPTLLQRVFESYCNPNLTGFEISAWKLTTSQWIEIFDFLNSTPQITFLFLSLNQVGDEVYQLIANFLKSNKTISELRLDLYLLEDSNLNILEYGFKGISGFNHIKISLECKDDTKNPLGQILSSLTETKLHSLYLSDRYLDAKAVDALCTHILNNPQLINLEMCQAYINNDEAAKISEAIMKNCSVQRFSYSLDSKITPDGIKHFIDIVKNNKNLKIIDLWSLPLDEDCRIQILDAIQQPNNLEKVVLADVNFTDDHLEKIKSFLNGNQKLVDVNFNSNKFTDEGCVVIAESVSNCLNLKRFCINLNAEDENIIAQFFEKLKLNKTIIDFSVRDINTYEMVEPEKIKEMIESNKAQ